jgi:hypothetical protein
MGDNQADDAARPLIAVMPRWLVVVIAVAGLLAATGALVWAIRSPADFAGTFPRFLLCFTLALNGGVFLFVLYPWNYRLTKIPGIDLTMEVVGPAALIIILFLFLNRYMPAPESGRFHVFIDASGQEADAAEFANAKLQFSDTVKPEFYLVPATDGRHLYGVFIRYPENMPTVNAVIDLGLVFEPEKITFQRDSAEPVKLKLELRKKR